MLTETELKRQLQTSAANDYGVPEHADYWQLTQDMLAHIGSTDPELRDDLIYTTFVKWAGADRYTDDQYRALLNTALDGQHLFFHLGEPDTTAVFTRSFSALLGVLPIYHHRQQPFLTPDEVRGALDQVLDYFARESDLRGFVEDMGWAHAVAHTADLLDELAQCEEIDRTGLARILAAIHAKAATPETIYVAEEDERLAYAALSLLGRGRLTEEEVGAWIKSFAPIERVGAWRERHLNTKNFLRSLYFQAQYRRVAEWVRAPIDETLFTITRFK
ncbi:hypothetical protein TFLX_04665 [Thermoflexales bacterium]|nr:hypothetical protein TFLX_04665 [Thermoflexales bacterium]